MSGAPLGTGGIFSTSESANVVFNTRMAVLVFEGRDVIDLPVDNLEFEGNALTLPDRIYRCYYAGTERLITPGDNVSVDTAVAFGSRTSDNLFQRVELSEGAADDAQATERALGKQFVDSASNKILVDGSPAFVSYTAIDRPLFRDVIYSRVSAQAFGAGSGLSGQTILTDVSGGNAVSYFIRFAFVDVASDGEGPRLAWKMAESYGINPVGEIIRTPSDLFDNLSAEEQAASRSAEILKHFVYDLGNEEEELTGEDFQRVPTKTAYSPALARAKTNPASPYFEREFRAQTINVQPGFAEGGLTTQHSVTSPTGSIVRTDFSFTSPTNEIELAATGRIGFEYVLQRTGGGGAGGVRDVLFLATTTEAADGIASYYDEAVNVTVVIDTFPGPSGGVLIERTMDDVSWAQGRVPNLDSVTNKFLLGEYPHRSVGQLVFNPDIAEDLNAEISGSDITIPAERTVTGIILSLDGSPEGTFLLGSSDDPGEDAVFEAAIPEESTRNVSSPDPAIFVGVPPITFTNFKSGGRLSLRGIRGVDSGKDFLPALEGDSSTPSGLQISGIEEQPFPVGGSLPTAVTDVQKGRYFLAFENEGRIDMAVRPSLDQPWVMVRDVLLRIPDNFNDGESTTDDLPPVSSPVLVNDTSLSDLILFYIYKKRLMARNIPIEIFEFSQPETDAAVSEDVISTQNLSFDETSVITKLHNLSSTVVYDASSTEEGDGADGLAIDVEFGNVIPVALSQEEEAVQIGQNGDVAKDQIVQHSECQSITGNIYSFIQVGDKIVIRVSANVGESWRDAVANPTEGIRLVQPLPDEDENSAREEFPTCGYDQANDTIMVFFFLDGKLLMTKIPGSTLQLSADIVESAFLNNLKPILLVGNLTEDLESRGISAGFLEEETENQPSENQEEQRLTPHRVSFVVTANGHYRIFYKDHERKLKSLISINNGDLWLTEEQLTSQEDIL